MTGIKNLLIVGALIAGGVLGHDNNGRYIRDENGYEGGRDRSHSHHYREHSHHDDGINPVEAARNGYPYIPDCHTTVITPIPTSTMVPSSTDCSTLVPTISPSSTVVPTTTVSPTLMPTVSPSSDRHSSHSMSCKCTATVTTTVSPSDANGSSTNQPSSVYVIVGLVVLAALIL